MQSQQCLGRDVEDEVSLLQVAQGDLHDRKTLGKPAQIRSKESMDSVAAASQTTSSASRKDGAGHKIDEIFAFILSGARILMDELRKDKPVLWKPHGTRSAAHPDVLSAEGANRTDVSGKQDPYANIEEDSPSYDATGGLKHERHAEKRMVEALGSSVKFLLVLLVGALSLGALALCMFGTTFVVNWRMSELGEDEFAETAAEDSFFANALAIPQDTALSQRSVRYVPFQGIAHRLAQSPSKVTALSKLSEEEEGQQP